MQLTAEKRSLPRYNRCMTKVAFVYDDIFLRHAPPPWHPDSRERLTGIILALKASGLWPKLLICRPRCASAEDLGRVHSPAYLEKIRSLPPGPLDEDTFLSSESFSAALHAAGAVMEAIDRCRADTPVCTLSRLAYSVPMVSNSHALMP